jgi:DNA transformation protein
MSTPDAGFADYCCELLSCLGPCRAKRMFGGWGISCDGLSVAIIADLGDGDTLWLKASADSRAVFEAEGCKRFTYLAQGVERGMNYYSAPADAMESPALMQPWARLAWQAALAARKPPRAKVRTQPASGRPKPV